MLAYFCGPEFVDGGLDGAERLEFTRLELDRGLWSTTEGGLSHRQPAGEERCWTPTNKVAFYRGWNDRRPVGRHPIGTVWRWADTSFAAGERARQVERLAVQVARSTVLTALRCRGSCPVRSSPSCTKLNQ